MINSKSQLVSKLITTGSLGNGNSRGFIGLTIEVYEPNVWRVRVILGDVFTLTLFSFLYFGNHFNETIIPLALAGYEIIKANSMLYTSLAV